LDYPAAVAEFREAHRLNPNDAEMHCVFGNALEHQGKVEEAEKEYREAPQLKPGDAAILSAVAYFLDRQGRRKEARLFWEKALKAEKKHDGACLIKARLAEPD
jgi:Flp pilus assembly protein TadD